MAAPRAARLRRRPRRPGRRGERGSRPEDFTGSIRTARRRWPAAPDLFEEEYGQVDVESAIAAFEKAHPEFEPRRGDGDPAPEAGRRRRRAGPRSPSHAASLLRLAEWLRRGARVRGAPPPPPAPAPFWVPREPEPELAADPVRRRRLGVRHASGAGVESQRADEAPTQQIPLAAEYAALGRMTDAPADRETDPTAPPRSGGEDGRDRSCRDARDPRRAARAVRRRPGSRGDRGARAERRRSGS